ncbi:LacI family DNA-binding transcriptional regulator [Amnibacterium sp.]|uniref:LacI family DNA-binding transcriptional regulator n=1 Tax=Amnibacterium sp. TaxID=1872496 RepID=UPI003F7C8155
MSDVIKRPPSMVDVAKAAGVAHITVSRVLNDPDTVRPETRRRVEAAVAELGYRRNDAARNLRMGRSTTLGLIIAGWELFELPRTLLGVERVARNDGYWISMASSQGPEPDRLAEAIGRLTEQQVEGIVIIADRPAVEEFLDDFAPPVPVSIVTYGGVANPRLASIELDQVLGARLATRHLLDLGHTHVAHIAGRPGVYDAHARIDGWRTEMATSDRAVPVLMDGDFTAASGYLAVKQLWASGERPTAIFAGNDQMAMGALAAFAELDVRVPADVSIVGFDDIAGAQYLVPSLTTVRQDFQALGEQATRVLLDEIAGAEPAHHLIPPMLIERSSTAALAR